jgi:hypothetical protein
MPAKKHLNKKTPGQKKIISAIAKAERDDDFTMSPASGSEDAIVRQFHRIQRGYSILMSEVVKEYDLIKDWIEKEASVRTEEWKHKITDKLPRI